MFEKEYEYFAKNRERLTKKYPGKSLIIRGNKVEGVFDTPLEAVLAADKQFEPGSVMIQQCEVSPDAYPVRVASAFPMFA